MSGEKIEFGDATTLTVADIGSVYGGGSLVNIDLKDLVSNEVAIRQLINNHNDQAKKRNDAERRLADKESEIEFLKTSPFVAVFALVFNTGGALVIGLATKWFTAEKPVPNSGWMIVLGAVFILTGGLLNVLYPFARRMFNKKIKT